MDKRAQTCSVNADGSDCDDEREKRVPLRVVLVREDGGQRDGEERGAEGPGPQRAHVGADVPAHVERFSPRLPTGVK